MSLILDNLDLVMFGVLCAGILLGFPVIFTLSGIGIAFALIGNATGHFDIALMRAFSTRIFGIMTNEVLMAIPMFVLMGVILERSKLAEELLEEMGRLFGSLRGGLAVSVTIVGALLAASTGIVGATVVTMALIALPTMLRNGYSRELAAGAVCSAGTLGQIIPPSTMLIILSEVMSSGYQQAQFAQGLFSVETISVGQIFAASLVPGLMLVGLYIAYLLLFAWLRPSRAPALPPRAPQDRVSTGRLLRVLMPPIILIVAVLGSILGGVATPTEAASVGAVGALILAGQRFAPGASRIPTMLAAVGIVAMLVMTQFLDLRLGRAAIGTEAERLGIWLAAGLSALVAYGVLVSLWRALRSGVLGAIVGQTMVVTCMIFAMLIGASIFSLVFRGLGGDVRVEAFLTNMPGGQAAALFFVMALIFVMGFFLDFVEISVIVLPIVIPVLLLMDTDPIWLAVMIAINLQTSFMTPPFGFSLFYLRGAAPPEVRTLDIYRGVAPFVIINVIGIFVIYLFPIIGTWLPRALFG
ncbi:MAG: TRAP transporter large permease subunit [Rhodospirillaceae bacterium]|nr:TRAP transporter large permease subunit [Rhodospirillaceae bacterium]